MGVPAREIHVFTERVGGGFGGKQEMVSEDLPLFATMKLDGRPVKWEWTREDEFIGATTRHQMTTKVKIGAKKDGTLTALDVHVVSNTGAYGNHASETLAAAMAMPVRGLSLREQEGRGPRRLYQHDPGRRVPGLRRLADDLRHGMRDGRPGAPSGHRPVRDAAQERRAPGDNVESIWKEPSDASFGSHGIDQCLDIVETRARRRAMASRSRTARTGPKATGMALAMLECGPPTEHRSGAEMKLLPDGTYHLACGSSEMGNGITTAHKQIAASIVGVRARDVDIINADTDRTPYDTGTFASTGTVVAGKAVHITAEAMRDDILDFAARHTGVDRDKCRLDNDAVVCGNRRILLTELHTAGAKVNHRFTVSRRAYLSPRTIAFNVQGVRLAVHRITGEVRILHSVHAADIGRPINPMQCRGQLDGAVAMGYGWALIENMVHDEGHMVNPQLRNCRVPAFADTPHTDIFFADTIDTIGPLGAKSQGECGINPVAPAVSNALANATGARFAHLPFTPDRLYAKLAKAT